MTCATCSAREMEGVDLHYAWCSVVGGPGYHPGSLQAMARAVREHREEQHRLAAEQARLAAAEAERQKSNNGWVKYNGHERSYEHLAATDVRRDFDEMVDLAVAKFERDSTPVPQGSEEGIITRPGRELPKYWRGIATKVVVEQGWRYEYKRRGGSHPKLYPPDGGAPVSLPTTVTDGHAGHRASYLSALKRAGARLDVA